MVEVLSMGATEVSNLGEEVVLGDGAAFAD